MILEGYSPWGRKDLDTTDWLTLSFSSSIVLKFWYFKITENQKAVLMLFFSGEEV